MTPLCKIEVTLPPVSGSREVHHGGGVDEQEGVQPTYEANPEWCQNIVSSHFNGVAGVWAARRSATRSRLWALNAAGPLAGAHRGITGGGLAPLAAPTKLSGDPDRLGLTI
jgi:hypothetical protein